MTVERPAATCAPFVMCSDGGTVQTLRKAEDSLDEQASEVRQAWSAQYSNQLAAQSSWVEEVYADHVVVCQNGEHYSVAYTEDPDDVFTFDVANATEVERTWTEVQKTVAIAKIDDERQVAFGWAYQYEKGDGERIVDHSGEFIKGDDLEDAAYVFNLNFREGDEVHTEDVKAHLIESVVFTPEKLEALGLAKDALPHGWWTGWYIPDAKVFGKVKDGTYAMLSIGGWADKELVDA